MGSHLIDSAGALTPGVTPDGPALWYWLPTYQHSVTPHRTLFTGLTYFTTPLFISPGGPSQLLSIATGSIILNLGGKDLVLDDVQHVPGAQHNILGGEHVLKDIGGTAEYREGEYVVIKGSDGKPVLKGMWDGRGWRVRAAVWGARQAGREKEEEEEGPAEVVTEDEMAKLQAAGKAPQVEEGKE